MFKGLVNTLSCVHLSDEGHNMFKYSPVWAKYSELQKIFSFGYGKFYCILATILLNVYVCAHCQIIIMIQ